ncbi:VWA domain-containing protein [Solibacillus sp. CAU 1738]|uniref:vWA domain-containing protein n=1 Tax=Solibacillus sp. CAU 1738 TaxID=3140363 RepID=UPI0032609414
MKKLSIFTFILMLNLVLVACNEKTKDEVSGTDQEQNKQVITEKEITDTEIEINDSDTDSTTSSEEQELTEEPVGIQSDSLVDNVPPIPTNFEEIISYPVGPFSGNGKSSRLDRKNTMTDEELMDAILTTLPPFTEEQLKNPDFLDRWFSALYYLIAEDYKNPQFIFDEMALHSFGKPMINGKLIELKEQLNVLIILDASGSMNNTINGEKMMSIAQRQLNELIYKLPDNVNVGLRIYGGKDGEENGKCSKTKLYHPISSGNKMEIKSTIDNVIPGGWTPIAESLKQAAQDFENYSNEKNTNFIYLISDGVETCDGDTIKEVQNLRASNIEPVVNVIGFNVDVNGQKELETIAEQGQGQYIHVSNEQAFADSMKNIEDIVKAWEKRHFEAIDDALTARGKLDEAIYDLTRDWDRKLTDEYKVIMDIMDALNSSDGYFEDKQVFHDVHSTLLQKISDKNDLYRDEFEKKSAELKENVNAAYDNILYEINNN